MRFDDGWYNPEAPFDEPRGPPKAVSKFGKTAIAIMLVFLAVSFFLFLTVLWTLS